MKVGIYLPGLGESYRKESAEKYARFFTRQLDFDNPDYRPVYETKTDIIEYHPDLKLKCARTSIIEKVNGTEKTVYKFYEYKYGSVITQNFINKNAFIKAWLLLLNVVFKFPQLLLKLIYVGRGIGYRPKYRGQTLFLFLIFLLVSAAIVFLLPAAFAILLNFFKQDMVIIETANFFKGLFRLLPFSEEMIASIKENNLIPSWEGAKDFSQLIVNLTSIILILIPGFNNTIISLACEFVSASNYLNHGETKRRIHGQMDLLLEKIVEIEGPEVEVCIHAYSFGSLITLDYLFPFGTEPTVRVQQLVKGIVTVGCPHDFIAIYFPNFLKNRDLTMNNKLQWINVYSLEDSLGSNFRKDSKPGDPVYSFDKKVQMPININYEIAKTNMNFIYQFISLYSLKAHTKYWDEEDDSSTCLKLVVPKMKTLNLL